MQKTTRNAKQHTNKVKMFEEEHKEQKIAKVQKAVPEECVKADKRTNCVGNADVTKHINMIRNCAAQKDLKGAVDAFDSLQKSGVGLNPIIYNTVLDACVQCHDFSAAEAWVEKSKTAGMADVVSFNILIKAHLQTGNLDKVRCLMAEMTKEGFAPNGVTFNELINALGSMGGDACRKQMWAVVDEMKIVGVKASQVTMSIMLKSLNSWSCQTDIVKTLELIGIMDEPMDEVLLSSVVEACVRIGQPDLLQIQLNKLQNNPAITINGSHTYGSLIKAYGHARNVDGIWRCWKEMRSRHISPSSITIGCMIQAIVRNGDTEGAYDLIQQIQDDENCRGSLNSVVYCSVLKGFTREKKMDRAMEVYKEMRNGNFELSVIMFNTLIDACARCGRMDYLPNLVADMKTQGLQPNVVTYSTMLKGHCQNGEVQKGFAILEQMKTEAHLKPDEIMYNSLLDGCAQNNLFEEGLRLLEEMQTGGVKPSNFTLSIVVKLMNRARRLDQAFSLVADITQKYHFHANMHVYTNLVHACVQNHQLKRGMGVLEQMVAEGIAPDSRTYAILVRASISKELFDQAVGLLKGALGLEEALPFLQTSCAVCTNLDSALVNEVLGSLAARGRAKDLAVPLLACIKQHAPKVRIDAATQRNIMSPCISSDLPSETGDRRQVKGKGKGGWDRW